MQQRTFAASPASVPEARRFVAATLRNVAGDSVDQVLLMVSELATNCVRHAVTGFRVTVERTDELLRVEVADEGKGQPEMRNPGPHDVSGRGLRIVDVLADQWGVATATPRGAKVWFTVRLVAA